jgi:hypothetical protein
MNIYKKHIGGVSMPFGDGRGPLWADDYDNRDFGYGRGRAYGGRMGAGRRPRGRAFEGRGYGRGLARGFGAGYGYRYGYDVPIDEKEALKREKEFLERELQDIKNRLGE